MKIKQESLDESNNQITVQGKNEFNAIFAQWKLKCSDFGPRKYKADIGKLLLSNLFDAWIENFNSVSGIEDYRFSAVQLLTISSIDPKKHEKYTGWDTRVTKLFDSLLREKAIGNDLGKIKQREFANKILQIPMFIEHNPHIEAWVRHFYTERLSTFCFGDLNQIEINVRQKILKVHQVGTEDYHEYNHYFIKTPEELFGSEDWFAKYQANEENLVEPDWFIICRCTYPELFGEDNK